MSKPSLILASESPFRKALMEQVGFPFECHSPPLDEREVQKTFTGSNPEVAEFLAKAKALSLSQKFPEHIIIGSDQTLILEGDIFHKPKTKQEVIERLMLLQGKTHELHTGLCLHKKGETKTMTSLARMTMHPLTLEEAQNYAELDQPIGCAGGYKIEQTGPVLFSKIETTDYFSIIGLPVLSLVSILREWGISRL